MEKKINLTTEDKIKKKIEMDGWVFQCRALEQENKIIEEDIKEDMPNKRVRLRIRQNQVEIAKLKWDIKVFEKMLREGAETIEEATPEDIKKFNKERGI